MEPLQARYCWVVALHQRQAPVRLPGREEFREEGVVAAVESSVASAVVHQVDVGAPARRTPRGALWADGRIRPTATRVATDPHERSTRAHREVARRRPAVAGPRLRHPSRAIGLPCRDADALGRRPRLEA
jgi:hypothetical protein